MVLQLHGKTSLAIELAKRLNGEIISADSMQIYKHMDIGTAKPTAEEMQGIKHYLIDYVEPNEEYNITKYKNDAEEAIKEIIEKGKTPIIVGGTGLYINTLTNGIEFSEIPRDEEYERKMEDRAKTFGTEYLYNLLKEVDPVSADNIEPNNVRRVIRALEIYKATGIPKSQLDKESVKGPKYDYRVFGIKWDRQKLYDRINRRVDIMINDGLISEVKDLVSNYKMSKTAMQGLGYKEVVDYLDGKLSYDEMVDKIKMESRRYAKRQLTWFRNTDGLTWIDGENQENMLNEIISNFNN